MEKMLRFGVGIQGQRDRRMQHFENKFQNLNLVLEDTDEDLSTLSHGLLAEWSERETQCLGEMNDIEAAQINGESKELKCVSDEELMMYLASEDPRTKLFAEKYIQFTALGLDSRVAQTLCMFYKSGAANRDSFEEYFIKMLRKYNPQEIVSLLEDLQGMDLEQVNNLSGYCLKMVKQRGLKPIQCTANEGPKTRRRKIQWKSLQIYEKTKQSEKKLEAKDSRIATVKEKWLCRKEPTSSDQRKVYQGTVLTASKPRVQIGKMSRLSQPPQSINQCKVEQTSESHADTRNDDNKENSTTEVLPKSVSEGKVACGTNRQTSNVYTKDRSKAGQMSISHTDTRNDDKENSTTEVPPKSVSEGKVTCGTNRQASNVHAKDPSKAGQINELHEDTRSDDDKENSTTKVLPKSVSEGKVVCGTNHQGSNVHAKVKHAYAKLTQPLANTLFNLHRVEKLPADQPLDDIVLMYLCQLSESKALQLLMAYDAQDHVQDRVDNVSVYFMDFAFRFHKQKS